MSLLRFFERISLVDVDFELLLRKHLEKLCGVLVKFFSRVDVAAKCWPGDLDAPRG